VARHQRKREAADSSEIRLIAVKAKADKPGIYHLTFIAPDSLPNDAVIELTFPPEFGLEPLEIAGSKDMTGGLRLQKNNQTVVVNRPLSWKNRYACVFKFSNPIAAGMQP